jgi:hypothetical protein
MASRISKKLVGFGLAGALVVGAGAAAWAQTSGGSATSGDTAGGGHGHPGLALLRRADHGTVEVKNKDGSWVTVTFDRGTVTAASASSITLQRPDGQSVTIALTADTRYRGISSADQIATGKAAIVASDSNGNALLVAQGAAAAQG